MPQEDRHIIFTNDEIYKAIYAMSHKQNIKKPPPGTIDKICEHEKDSNKIVVFLKNPQEKDNKTITIEYSRDFIAAALMLFCKGCGIPLPKQAKKSVIVQNDSLVLRMKI